MNKLVIILILLSFEIMAQTHTTPGGGPGETEDHAVLCVGQSEKISALEVKVMKKLGHKLQGRNESLKILNKLLLERSLKIAQSPETELNLNFSCKCADLQEVEELHNLTKDLKCPEIEKDLLFLETLKQVISCEAK